MSKRSQPKRKVSASRRRRLTRCLETLEPRQLLASLAGEIWADTNADGIRDPDEAPAANVRVYVDSNDNAQFDPGEPLTATDDLGGYVFDQLLAGSHVVRTDLSPGQTQTSPKGFFGTGYPSNDGSTPAQTQLFELDVDGNVRFIGDPSTDRIQGLVRTNAGEFFGINFQNDTIFSVDGETGESTALFTSTQDLVAGLAYDPETDTIYTVANQGGISAWWTVDQTSGQLTPVVSRSSGNYHG